MIHLDTEILQNVLESNLVEDSGTIKSSVSGLSIDTRTIKSGEIFFAIVGDNNDGHDYVDNAFKRGAAAAVINRAHLNRFADYKAGPLLAVNDTHEALIDLAGYIRLRSQTKFAAVTGSNGKTTTKEMLYSIISVNHSAYRSPGNLNNLFGLPVSLGMMPETDYAVFELGISTPGEMSRLASIIKPELALITNIGPAHLETLKTIDNIVKAKFELIDKLPVGAAIILNADDELIMAEAKRRNLDYIGFGVDNDCHFRAQNIDVDTSGKASFDIEGIRISLPLYGKINVYNAAAAIAASSIWGCEQNDWTTGLPKVQPIEMRLILERFGQLNLLIDCYNANPASVKEALSILKDFKTPARKIAVLGDMLELGESSRDLHTEIGKSAARAGVDFLLCLGEQSQATITGAIDEGMKSTAAIGFVGKQELLNHLLSIIEKDDLILFKGSRGMELEKIVIGLKGSAFKSN